MRQALDHVFNRGVRQSSRCFRCSRCSRCSRSTAHARFFAFTATVGLFLVSAVPVVAAAEPLKSRSTLEAAETRTVSPAKPVVILPREAGAKQQAKNFVGIGPIFGFTTHVESPVTGMLGLELSYVRYPYAAFGFGMGGFVQGQTVGFNHARFAFGPQFNFTMFGAEVGAYLEEGSGKRATTVGVHASPFVSLGFFSAALRIAVPLGTLTEGNPYGIDIGLVCAIKLPIPLDGQLFGLAFH